MLAFVQKWVAPKPAPIGVDFGTDSLRLAQVHFDGTDHQLLAAASTPVPVGIRNDFAARMDFFSSSVRDLLAQGKFKGRSVVLGLPSALSFVRHLRMPKMDEAALKKALAGEAMGKLPIDPVESLMRHLIAGEVYQDQELRFEVILMAVRRAHVDGLLAAAAKAKLDVVGMTGEPSAMVDCFGHVYRRKADASSTTLFLDIGSSGTRVVIARGAKILFMRNIDVGGAQLDGAVAETMKVHVDDARILRQKLTHSQITSADSVRAGLAEEPADPSVISANTTAPAQDGRAGAIIETAMQEPLDKMIEELRMCRRYHEATFPSVPVDRIIFGGGESRSRFVCQYVARAIGLPAQLGDPMVRLSKAGTIGMECGIDRRQPQPGWSVALGLAMGPAKSRAQVPTASSTEESSDASASNRSKEAA